MRGTGLAGPLGALLLTACTTTGASLDERPTAPAERQASPVSRRAPPASRSMGSPTPPRMLTDPGSGVFLVWSGAAAQAAITARRLLVLAPDLRHVSAIDWRDGEARWRIEYPSTPGTQMHGLDDRVLLYDEDQAVMIEAARGRILGRHEVPRAAAERPPIPRQVRGACAWVGACELRAFDCADGHPLGSPPPRRARGEVPTSCVSEPQLLGRHADVIVMVGRPPPPSTMTTALFGIDATTGEPQWKQALPPRPTPAGVTDDGGCWVLDPQVPELRVFDCAGGRLRWSRAFDPGPLEVYAAQDTVVVGHFYGNRWRVSAYASTDGTPEWSTRLARRKLPILPASPVADAQTTGRRRVYALIDSAAGGVTGELVAGRDERMWLDPGGGFVLIGRELRELDPVGHLTRQRPFTGIRTRTITEGHVVTQSADSIEIYDREQLRERARLEGRLEVIEDNDLPGDRLLLQREGPDGVVLMLGLSAPSRRAKRR